MQTLDKQLGRLLILPRRATIRRLYYQLKPLSMYLLNKTVVVGVISIQNF